MTGSRLLATSPTRSTLRQNTSPSADAQTAGFSWAHRFTQHPELFSAVWCGYPLLDMLRYQKFEQGAHWTTEYGTAEKQKDFTYLYKYSPYQNVKPQSDYPAVMFFTGDSDTRVDPLHARKMAALLQFESKSGRPVLLHYSTTGGHSCWRKRGAADPGRRRPTLLSVDRDRHSVQDETGCAAGRQSNPESERGRMRDQCVVELRPEWESDRDRSIRHLTLGAMSDICFLPCRNRHKPRLKKLRQFRQPASLVHQ